MLLITHLNKRIAEATKKIEGMLFLKQTIIRITQMKEFQGRDNHKKSYLIISQPQE